MRKVTMVRLGIAAAVTTIGAVGAFASGCSSDDNGTTGGNETDAGNGGDANNVTPGDSGGPTTDGATGDAAASPDAGTLPPDAKLIIVHAAQGLGPIRLCFATAQQGASVASVTNINALPDGPGSVPPFAPPPAYGPGYDGGVGQTTPGAPGIYPGAIGAFPDITSLANFAITPYLIDANLLANNTADAGPDGGAELTCQKIIGEHGQGVTDSPVAGFLSTSQFITLPTIASGTFLDGTTWLLSVTGCVPGFQPDPGATAAGITANDICGPDYTPATGNIKVGATQIDTTTVPADGGWGVQYADRSVTIEGTTAYTFEQNGTPVPLHGPASAGLIPTFLTPTVVPVDAGADDGSADGATDAAPTTTTVLLPAPLQNPAAPIKEAPTQITPVTTVQVNPTGEYFGFLTAPGSGDGGAFVYTPYPASTTGPGDVFALPLSDIQQLSKWQATTVTAPATYAPGTTFTFVVVGSNVVSVPQLETPEGAPNVLVDGGTYDGRGLHIVAFPNSFTPVTQP